MNKENYIEDMQEMKNIILGLEFKCKQLEQSLKEIESITRNPREYEPSYYSINHIARKVLETK